MLAASYSGKPNSKLVVISQTCDILAASEQTITAMRIDVVHNPEHLRRAMRSSRQFVLDEARGLIVDARTLVLVEKELLETLQPEVGAPGRAEERAFARWLARRFARAAHPDAFVDAVRRPLENYLETLYSSGDARASAMQAVEFRVLPPFVDTPPFDVHLVFVLNDDSPEAAAFVASSLEDLKRLISGPSISSLAMDLVTLRELSAADYLATDELIS
jgi:hypothetical protein